MSTSTPVANFASGLGKYDSTIVSSVVSDAIAGSGGTGDASFNTGYVLNTASYTLPSAVTGNGVSFSGWFYPTVSESANTALFDVSCVAGATTGNIALFFTGTNALSVTYNGVTVATSSNVYTNNAWNFFMYTVCCSGNVAVQNLYVNTIGTGANPAVATASTATYAQFTVVSTYLGYGVGTYGGSKYVGKMDEFRFYNRVISPMEYRVLQGFDYTKGNSTAVSLTPLLTSLGTVTVQYLSFGMNLVFPNTGTYSYVSITRSDLLGTVYLGTISPAQMVLSGSNYLWYDTTLKSGTASYVITPYVLGKPGSFQTVVAVGVAVLAISNVSITTSNAIYAGNRIGVNSNNLGSGDGILIGTSTTNGNSYTVYAFGQVSTSMTYTMTYTCYSQTYIYVLAVGGGGGGGAGGGGGGGGGGVVMVPVLIPTGIANNMVISVGAGGVRGTTYTGITGSNTTVTFSNSSVSIPNIIAYGGGAGSWSNTTPLPGGSGGGSQSSTFTYSNLSTNYNFGNPGMNIAFASTSASAGGGGGAGMIFTPSTTYCAGGNGIQCFLPGIKDFAPAGTPYGYYYWGGGGGACGYNTNTTSTPGGLGGGGGGSTGGTLSPNLSGGGQALNSGGSGSVSDGPGGDGGANTGGGGGGKVNNWSGGTGGSGIVIMAIPSFPVTSNAQAVLPATTLYNGYSTGKYNDVLSNDTYNNTKVPLSAAARGSIRGGFSCRLINYDYFGPVMCLRASTDVSGMYAANFYADVCGNLGTGYLGTGLSVVDWLTGMGANKTYAYVVKWYNQGMDVSFSSATQYTTSAQPIYDVSYKLMNFGYTGAGGGVAAPQTGCYFNLPNGALPFNDTSYSYVSKVYNVPSTSTYGMILVTGGISQANHQSSLSISNPTTNAPWSVYDGWNGSYNATTAAIAPSFANGIVGTMYNASTAAVGNAMAFYNGAGGSSYATSATNKSGRAQDSSLNVIGSSANSLAPFNGQMFYLYIFGASLTGALAADLSLCMATPATYDQPNYKSLALTVTSSTSTSLTVSTGTVTGASYFEVYYNGTVAYTSATGITALSSAVIPLSTLSNSVYTLNPFLNAFAYDSNHKLLAYYGNLMGYPIAVMSITTSSTSYAGNRIGSNSNSLSGGDGIVIGSSVTNNIPYNVYAFGRDASSSGMTYTMTYTCYTQTYIYVLAVGGGGGGATYGGGGGGAGGVVMVPVLVPTGVANNIAISVGGGGAGQAAAANTSNSSNGGINTTVTFSNSSVSIPNIVAYGGGYGNSNALVGGGGGSSGGSGLNYTGYGTFVSNSNMNYNFGNSTAYTTSTTSGFTSSGGGGAGTYPGQLTLATAIGGNGIQCFLPGIKDFAPSGIPYGYYYWGGGGGGGIGNIAGTNFNTSAGLGGGGGGAIASSSGTVNFIVNGGGQSLNSGGNGAFYNGSGGAGGANTGGGGGGAWNGASAAGGSGIVVVAIPASVPVTSNAQAVLPATGYNGYVTGKYNDVLSNDTFGGTKTTMSANARSSIRGGFSCRLINYDYFGPVMCLRASTDSSGTYTANFYADVCGNLGTGYLGTGTSVVDWLTGLGANRTYAYVVKWYNQGMDVSFSSATQYDSSWQPIYDVSYKLMNFGYQGGLGGVASPKAGCYFNLPNGALPFNDTSYSYTLKHWNYAASGTMITGGTLGTANAYTFSLGYSQEWYNAGKQGFVPGPVGTLAPNNIVTASYTGNIGTELIYVNGVSYTYSPGVARAQTQINNVIGSNISWTGPTAFNGQMYYLYIFASSLTDADRNIAEATPATYDQPNYKSLALTVNSSTSTSVTLSTTAVTGASYFEVYYNGTVAYTSSTGITTLSSALIPLTTYSSALSLLNVFAYDTNNKLLAYGGFPFTVMSITTSSTSYAGNRIGSISNNLASGDGIVIGTSVTNGIAYNVYAFGQVSTSMTYTMTYTCYATTYIYVLAVGGGGGGGAYVGGGGGAGGVVMVPVLVTAGSANTMAISVGAGGVAGLSTAGTGAGPIGTNGTNTTVTFSNSSVSIPNIIAYGGGYGAGFAASAAVAGGTGGSGGGVNAYSSIAAQGGSLSINYNFGNQGGVYVAAMSNSSSGGGGGAGTYPGQSNYASSVGGSGIQCFLPGIKDFAPAGIPYGYYYWGGGGGGGELGVSVSSNSSGGIGGGGGGTNYNYTIAIGTITSGGGQAINSGGAGALVNGAYAGNGGANTGGGGGAGWSFSGGAGGSGIVIVAIPTTPVTSNAQAVLPATTYYNGYATGKYNDVLSNDTFNGTKTAMSASARGSIRGGFSCRLINYDYFGPVMCLRASTDGSGIYTANFYADVCGNLGTGYLGTGTSVVDWLTGLGANRTYAYVVKWYNQGMDVSFSSATQYTTTLQPIYDVSYKFINTGYQGGNGGVAAPQQNCYFNLPNGALPFNDTSYSYVTKLYNVTSNGVNYPTISCGGSSSSNSATTFGLYNANAPWKLTNDWSNTGTNYVQTTAIVPSFANATMSIKYNATSGGATNNLGVFYNGTGTYSTTNISGRTQPATSNYIGFGFTNYLNGQMFFFYVFGSSLTDADRNTVEATPSSYDQPNYASLALTVNSSTSTSVTVSTTAVTGASYFEVYYNGTVAYTSAASITALSSALIPLSTYSSALLLLNVFAYDINHKLLAYGGYPFTVTFIATTSASYTGNRIGVNSNNLASGDGIVIGSSVTNGIAYNVYAFGRDASSSGMTYTMTYTCYNATYVYVLAVGGGGGGGSYGGGGGGAGGVVMVPVLVTAGSANTIAISIGAGGSGSVYNGTSGAGATNGISTTVTFRNSSVSIPNIVAYGGGYGGSGGSSGVNGGYSGGSGGGASTTSTLPGQPVYINYNFGNPGGYSYSNTQTGGGGGAGTNLSASTLTIGGSGIQCLLPGIKDFAPSGTPYGYYYWGGGGGGGLNSTGNTSGGIGGGGGGGTMSTTGNTSGGGLALNSGGYGSFSYGPGGSGGANTGGGGGGAWNVSGAAGAGGSGIVIIAIPASVPVTSNAQAVLPATTYYNGYATGKYNDVLSNDTFNGTKTAMSANARSTIRGGFSCRLINYDYFGPVMCLRASTDGSGIYTANFYADVCGNLGTGYLGTGSSVVDWLTGLSANRTYAYVVKWYNQGMDVSFSSATQYTPSLQPIYDVSYKLMNFGYTGAGGGVAAPQTGCYFNLPNGTVTPGNLSYTVTTKHFNQGNTTGTWLAGGTWNTTRAIGFRFQAPNTYDNYWFNLADFNTTSTYAANNIVTFKYDNTAGGNNNPAYIGNSLPLSLVDSYARTSSTKTIDVSNNYIGVGSDGASQPFNSQMYYLYIFNSALADTDRNTVEATPSSYDQPNYKSLALTINSSTSTSVTVSTTAVTGASYFEVYYNGTVAYTSAASITTLSSALIPLSTYSSALSLLNVFAYDINHKLLAYGGYPFTVMSITTSSTSYTGNRIGVNSNSLNYGDGIVIGSSVTNGIAYNIYAFGQVSSGMTYTMTYTCFSPTYIYVLAVGGGGGGGSVAGCGGGAGGVVMVPVLVPNGSANTMAISVGAGGAGGYQYPSVTASKIGVNTTVTFSNSSVSIPNIVAYGGGGGAGTSGGTGGSGGGASGNANPPTNFPGYSLNINYNFGNQGVVNVYNDFYRGGGGGAGTSNSSINNVAMVLNTATNYNSTGGNGIQCFLPGIKDFAPAGIPYGYYYWGGGGGGAVGNQTSSYTGIFNSSGGMGGGGGGASYANYSSFTLITNGGGMAINSGGMGSTSNVTGGAGGANTGGGGGGAWNDVAGSGGSGIVIIAIPTTPVTSNAQAVLPATTYYNGYATGKYNDVLSNDTFNGTKTVMSANARGSIRGGFSCRLINYDYFGPVMCLRASTDGSGIYTANFYADVCGNLGTGYLGTGSSVVDWLTGLGANRTYAYVVKWYNQGMDVSFSSATQYDGSWQPIYDVSYKLMNFGYQGGNGGVAAPRINCYFNLPNGALPFNDTSYSYVSKVYNIGALGTSNQYAAIASGGNYTGASTVTIFGLWGGSSPYTFANSWSGAPSVYYSTQIPSFANAPLSITYNSGGGANNAALFYNGGSTTGTLSGRTQVNTGNYIGVNTGVANYLNSQIFYLYVFASSLTDADRVLAEATPATYDQPNYKSLALTVNNSTSTSLTLSTVAVTGASYFEVYYNGTVAYTSATGITTLSSALIPLSTTNSVYTLYPLLNVFAYDTNNKLLAYFGNYIGYPITVTSITDTCANYLGNRIGSNSNALSSGDGIVIGTSTTNNIPYNVYAFGRDASSAAMTYTMTYTCFSPTYIYVLAVGGGGGGMSNGGGGGGAGGVVMVPVLVPTGSANTIAISVGAGGVAGYQINTTIVASKIGVNTTVTFGNSNVSIPNIVAYGGGNGANVTNAGLSGGSSGGGGIYYTGVNAVNYNMNYNFGNPGPLILISNGLSGSGGGGAGTSPGQLTPITNGGNGIQCFLPGIKDFAPAGTPYGYYYWGGGGAGTNGNTPANTSGGLGGGGGGAATVTSGILYGGGQALNPGGAGQFSNGPAGNGGANTGGGGGGAWNDIAGNGGSGIVVIAIPASTPVTSNAQAVLPTTGYNGYATGKYNDVLSNDTFNGTKTTMSASARGSIRGGFSCRLINYDYFGPVMCLRASTDGSGMYTANFYADVCGNLGTGYLGTGVSVVDWLTSYGANRTYAYVVKWYDQGMDVSFSSATQYTTSLQPIYDVSYKLMNYGYQGGLGGVAAPQTSCYFNLPDGTLPFNNSNFTYTFKYGNAPSNTANNGQSVISGGSTSANAGLTLGINAAGAYLLDLYGAGYSLGTYTTNAVLTWRYTNQSWNLNVNNGSTLTAATNVRVQTVGNNVIGTCKTGQGTNSYNPFNGQMYYMYVFASSLTDADRVLVEATPATYDQPNYTSLALTINNSTPSSFTLTTGTVTGANYFEVYNNGVVAYTSAAGTTSLSSVVVPLNTYSTSLLNVFAYDVSNKLLAYYGYTATGVPVIVNSITTSNASYAGNRIGSNSNALGSGDGILIGSSVTNNILYNVYAFGQSSTTMTYTMTYTCYTQTYIYVLAVGGGGGGGSWGGGGGGAGGVVMVPVLVPTGSANTMAISVGAACAGGINGIGPGNHGNPTTVTFSNSNVSIPNIIAYGGAYGGGGGTSTGVIGLPGGSGGGNQGSTFSYNNLSINYNFGNPGMNIAFSTACAGGGGGAGMIFKPYSGYCAGGNGIQCFLPGIKDFTPAGTPYGYYYWGGGGGASAVNSGVSTPGGLGGGGGGGTAASLDVGRTLKGGGQALNSGGNGSINNGPGGDGGANTGAGGGGAYAGNGGSGGSGIVIVAIPTTPVVSNAQAVLPATTYYNGYMSGKYNDVLSNDSFNSTKAPLSANARNTIRGGFSCRLINYDYFGPVMCLRASNDGYGTYAANFYADVCGNLGTGYLGTGMSVMDWLTSLGATTTYAYVVKWYNQGMDVSFSSATQYTTSLQPIYDVSYKLMNFGYTGAGGGVAAPQTSCYFNLPNGTVAPGNLSYTVTTKFFNSGNTTDGCWLGAGSFTNSTAIGCRFHSAISGYNNYWYNNDLFVTGYVAANSVVTFKYDNAASSSNSNAYIGTTLPLSSVSSSQRTGKNTDVINNNIGSRAGGGGEYFNSQMYYLYIFSSALADTDRNTVEATPATYDVPNYTSLTLTVNSSTSSSVTLTTSAVTNSTYFEVYYNGTMALSSPNSATSLSSLVVPINNFNAKYSLLNVFAYDTNNKLLAYVAKITTITVTTITTSSASYTGNRIGSNSNALSTGDGIVIGTAMTNDISYNVYAFGQDASTAMTYVMTYTCYTPTYMYVLAVGGGGGGGSFVGGGGGAGGVVMVPVLVPIATGNTISISIGKGGTAGTSGQTTSQTNGINTIVTFSNPSASIPTIIAYGGGKGGTSDIIVGQSGGSGGGGGYSGAGVVPAPGSSVNINYNFGNSGGNYVYCGAGFGGGGAGTYPGQGTVSAITGGSGIQCFLPGIKDFAPAGIPYGYYYWGGGGGGGVNNTTSNTSGGIGGGGGGANGSSGGITSGGVQAINSGGTGAVSNGTGGSGGANTGGGGGAACTAAAGAGGSGIVVIAIPASMPVTSNAQAVLPTTGYNGYATGKFNDVLSNDTFNGTKVPLSTIARSSIRGGFSCRLINYDYFGPVMCLRASTDGYGIYTANFYADVCGNLGTGYLGTGTSVVSWLSSLGATTTYAYVVKWYDQGMDSSFNSATQFTQSSQPIYDVYYKFINTGYTGAGGGVAAPQTNCMFNLPNGALPFNDTSYSYVSKLYNIGSTTTYGAIACGGTNLSKYQTIFGVYSSTAPYTLYNDWVGVATGGGAIIPSFANATMSISYNGSSAAVGNALVSYNGTVTPSSTNWTGRTQPNTNNGIGSNSTNYLNSQIFYLYVFASSLTDADRVLVEATPATYDQPNYTSLALTMSNPFNTSITLTTDTVTGASYFEVYYNGSLTYMSTAGTTALTSVSLTLNAFYSSLIKVFAYDSNNKLLANTSSFYTFNSLANWTNPVPSAMFMTALSNVIGYYGPALQMNGGAATLLNYVNIQVPNLSSLVGTTIQFYMYGVNGYSMFDFFFGCNSTGAGTFLRADFRSGLYTSLISAISWTNINGLGITASTSLSSGTWYAVTIKIISTTVYLYINNALIGSGTYVNNGAYIGFNADANGGNNSICYVTNFSINKT